MLIRHKQPVEAKREPIGKSNEATVCRISGTSTRYDGMVERMQKIAAGPIDQDFGIRVASYNHLVSPDSPFYHVSRFLALRAAKALFPKNIVDVKELRMFWNSEVLRAVTYSDFVSDDNGVVQRHAEAMREFYGTQFESRMAEMQFIAEFDRKERGLNPELERLPGMLKQAGIEPNHPEANYHLSNGKTVFFEINVIDLGKAAAAAVGAGAGGKHALEAIAAIYALLVHLEARNLVGTQEWYGNTETDRRQMKELYEDVATAPPHETYKLIFNVVSDMRDSSVIKLPDVFIRLGLIQLARDLGRALVNQTGGKMKWGPPARFPVESSIIAFMDDENHEIMKRKCKPLHPDRP